MMRTGRYTSADPAQFEWNIDYTKDQKKYYSQWTLGQDWTAYLYCQDKYVADHNGEYPFNSNGFNQVPEIIACLKPIRVKQLLEPTDTVCAWWAGQQGLMCLECQTGFVKNEDDTCGLCPHPVVNWITCFFVFCLLVFFQMGAQCSDASEDAAEKDPFDCLDILSRMLADWMAMMSEFISTLSISDMEWKVIWFFPFLERIFLWTDTMQSFECLQKETMLQPIVWGNADLLPWRRMSFWSWWFPLYFTLVILVVFGFKQIRLKCKLCNMRSKRKSKEKNKPAIASEDKESEAKEVIPKKEEELMEEIGTICPFIVSNIVMLLVVFQPVFID